MSGYLETTAGTPEAVRRIAMVERLPCSELLISPDWQPHAPTLQRQGRVYASRFPGQKRTAMAVGQSRWDSRAIDVEQTATPETRYYDLWHGVELKPKVIGQAATLAFEMEAHGYGAVLAVEGPRKPGNLDTLLHGMAERANIRLGNLSSQWQVLPQKIVEIPRTEPAKEVPEGMVLVPAASIASKFPAWRSKGATVRASTFSTLGKICRGAATTSRWTCKGSTSTSTRSPTPSSSGSSTLRATGPRMNTTSSRTGPTEPILGVGPQAGHLGLAGGRPGLRRLGWQAAAARMGVAVRGARRDGRLYPWGKEPDPAAARAAIRSPTASAERRRCVPQGREPVGRDGPRGQRLAVD